MEIELINYQVLQEDFFKLLYIFYDVLKFVKLHLFVDLLTFVVLFESSLLELKWTF